MPMQVNCSIAGNIVIRVLQYRATGEGYIQLTFLNTVGSIASVLLSASQANVSMSAETAAGFVGCLHLCQAVLKLHAAAGK